MKWDKLVERYIQAIKYRKKVRLAMAFLAACCFCTVLYFLIAPAETLENSTDVNSTVSNNETSLQTNALETEETNLTQETDTIQTQAVASPDEVTTEESTSPSDDATQAPPQEDTTLPDSPAETQTPQENNAATNFQTEEWDENTSIMAHAFSEVSNIDTDVAVVSSTFYFAAENIRDAAIYYKDSASNRWFEINDDTANVPANTQLRLNVSYQELSISDLIAAGGAIIYQLPDGLTKARANGIISGEDKSSVGMILADGKNYITLTYDTAWLQACLNEGQTVLQGDFNSYVEFDWEKYPDGGDINLNFGSIQKKVNLESDIAAKYQTVTLEKNCGQTILFDEAENYYYIEYTLKIKIPEEQTIAAPDISLQDIVTENAEYIDGYLFPDGLAVTNVENGVQIQFGDMNPGQSYELTYRVKLKEDYIGGHNKGVLTNQATVFSKEYEKDTAEVSYTPSAKMSVTKTAAEYNEADGTIEYTITVTAPQDNSYPMKNVIIKDYFDDKFISYLSYQEDTMTLDGVALLASQIQIDEETGSCFINIGDVEAGQSKILTYTVQTSSAILATDNHKVTLRNTAEVYTGEDFTITGEYYANAICEKELQKKAWSRKVVDTATKQEQTITMDTGDIYSAPNVREDSAITSFLVPEGSYVYRVIVNEAADWNMTNADFTDAFENDFLNFTGYVKVESFSAEMVANKGLDADSEDGTAFRILDYLTPDKVAWMAISGTSFSFQPSQLGIEGNCAYLLTYYAITNTEALKDTNQTSVTNNFSVSGNAYPPGYGPGNGTPVILPAVQASAPVIVQGGTQYTVNKQGWYYNLNEWTYGKLYWVVEVKGSIVEGMSLIDETVGWNNSTSNRLWDSAIYGVYKGSLKGKTFNGKEITSLTDCNSVNDLSQLGLQLLPQTSYTWTRNSDSYGTLTFKKSYNLGIDESIYVILMTEPHMWYSPSVTSYDFFLNKISSQSPGGSKVEHNTASLAVSGHDSLFKESVGVTEYNADTDTWTKVSGKRGESHLATDLITESGTYVEWIIHINWRTVLEGEAEITEQLPKGMKLQYVRLIGAAEHYLTEGSMPGTSVMSNLEQSDEWESYTVNTSSVYRINSWYDWREDLPLVTGKSASCIYYYNPSSNQAKWTVNNLYMKPVTNTNADDYYCKGTVDFQVVCRITEPSVLLGGEEKTFTNTASLIGSFDKVDSYEASVDIKKTTLTKTVAQKDITEDGTLDFSIDANPLGEDLMSDSDRVTLIDSMEKPLEIDISTLKVYRSIGDDKTELPASEWNIKVTETSSGGQLLEIELPDSAHVVIEYTAVLNTAPSDTEPITIQNTAYWKGYNTTNNGTINDKITYTGSGSAQTGGTPKLQLTKADKDNANQYLEGAYFSVKQLIQTAEGTFQMDETPILTGMTDASGQIGVNTDWESSGASLQSNTIYCLQETKPPEGYILDNTIHYFAVADAKDANYAEFQAQLDAAQESGLAINVWYGGMIYRTTIYNTKGKLNVDKVFWDSINNQEITTPPDGTYRFALYETAGGTGNYSSLLEIIWQLGSVSYRLDGKDVTEPAFTNLTAGKTYYIYELNEQDDIIASGEITQINGKMYGVTYKTNTKSGNSIFIDSATNAAYVPTLSILNTSVAQYVLPETGGSGTKSQQQLGIFLISTAMVIYCLRNFKRKKKGGKKTSQ